MSERKEDHRLFVTIITEESRIDDVLCKVFLPKRLTEPIEIYFHPTTEQRNKVKNIFEFSIIGDVKGFSGKSEIRLQSDKVYFKTTSTVHWGHDIVESIFVGKPTDLKVTKFLHHNASPLQKTEGNFWLTPSIMLSPRKSVKQFYNGKVDVETVAQCKFTLVNGLQLIFDNHYKFITNEDGDTVTHADLVAKFTAKPLVNNNGNIEEDAICYLDDFLLLASFAERNRCVCLEWDKYDSQSHVKYYRRDIVVPTIKIKNYIETLFDKSDFEEFIKQAYTKFIEIEPKDLVRQAIQYVVGVHSTEKPLENSFLSLYSALESLLLYFRRIQKLETVFDLSNEWNELQDCLKKQVKSFPPLINDKEKRILIYEKLPELNRISFSTVFNKFCQYYSIDLNDLWPVCNNSEGISLSEIRHNLIHGEYINLSHLNAIMSAKENLQWILERIILSILGWPISKSKVNENYLARFMTCYREWKEDRKILSKIKNS